MRSDLLPAEVARLGPLGFTDTLLASIVVAALLIVLA